MIPLKSPHRLIQFCIKHAADLRDRISQRPQGVLRYADLSVLISFLNLRKRHEIARRFILMMQMGFNPGMFQIGNHIEQLLIFSQRYQLLQAWQ